MTSNIVALEENVIKRYVNNYEKNVIELKNKASNYLKNNNDKDFSDISSTLKDLGTNQIVFPKKIRKQKTLKEIEEISISLYKLERKLKAFDIIDKEIMKNKTTDSEQTHKRNFENYLKVEKQGLLSKANKIIFDFNSLQLTSFDSKFSSFSIQKRTKKFILRLDRLTKKLENKIRIIVSDNTLDNNALRKTNRFLKMLEKLQLTLDILSNSKEQSDNKVPNQQSNKAITVAKDLEKVQQVLQDINNTNNALKLLKKAGSEQYIVELANKLNKDLENKQKQFVNMCRDLPEVKKLV